jgi:hypothetical protein
VDDLTTTEDVEAALLRKLTVDESAFIDRLITQASGLMRIAMPSVDDRIALWGEDGTNAPANALDPDAVSAVVAGALKRYLLRGDGVASVTEADGPFSKTVAYTRDGAAIGTELSILASDIAKLSPPAGGFAPARTIKLNVSRPVRGARW